MTVFVNGNFVSDDQAVISVFDRGLMYGDGCFETIRVYGGKPAFWSEHLERLSQTLKALSIPYLVDSNHLAWLARKLIEDNQVSNGVLRLQITRGLGHRGYSMEGADHPSLIVSIHPLPPGINDGFKVWKIRTSATRIDVESPLTGFKSSNKLLQILGKAEADIYQVDDVLFLTRNGHASETSSSNLFWFDGETICTPPLSAGILPGITRGVVIEIFQGRKNPVQERLITLQELQEQKIIFLTQSVWEIMAVFSLDGCPCLQSSAVESLRKEYTERALVSEFPVRPH
jgi:aminodeoxychorismate lyase